MSARYAEASIVAASSLLAAWLITKSVALFNAVRWVSEHGLAYESAARAEKPRTESQRIDLLRRSKGASFWPFGAKSYKLRIWLGMDVPTSGFARLVHHFADLFISAGKFMFIVDAFLLTSSLVTRGAPAGIALVVLSLLTSLYGIGLIVEAIAWYVHVGTYARSYFMLGLGNFSPKRRSALDEISVFAVILGFCGVNLSTLAVLVQRQFGSFAGMPKGHHLGALVPQFVDAVYFVLGNVTTTGVASPTPLGAWASVVGVLCLATSLLTLTFAVSVLSEVVQSSRRRR